MNIITYGTFDLLHYGHIALLKKAKNLGLNLTVGLSTDNFNLLKNKKSFFNYDQRKEILESIKFVDRVIPEHSWEQKIEDIKKLKIDIFTIGDDWENKFDYLNQYCKVIYLPRTENISTTMIKDILKNDFK
jgi:glycerol-3-phosphate cytidylyltransferase